MKELVTSPQRVPSAGPAREALRQKGQFWTPDWVAEAMVAYAISATSDHVFDPAVGAGAFFSAAKRVGALLHRPIRLLGMELYGSALEEARERGLSDEDLSQVGISDFLANPSQDRYDAIVANPPYIRHHRLSRDHKGFLKKYMESTIGKSVDGRAGLHIYFLVKALEQLRPSGRLAFIVPADTVEGVFADTLWNWITAKYSLEVVITFASEAVPFPKVDTNAIVLMIANRAPVKEFKWVRCQVRGPALLKWVLSDFTEIGNDLEVVDRRLDEGLTTGLSRRPYILPPDSRPLGDYVRVMRGIATGANDFFFLTKNEVLATGVPQRYFRRAVGRTRDVNGDVITEADLLALDNAGRPTYLLDVNGASEADLPVELRHYLRQGEAMGLPQRTLIATRRPWYRTEFRVPPPFLFAYLGRRHARFIRNLADVLPLTCFLCVYPHVNDDDHIARLWKVLNHPDTVGALALVGKSYGSGAIKVEPRALEKTPLYAHVLESAGLAKPIKSVQQSIQFARESF